MPESGTARTIHGLRITLPGDEPADELTEVTRLPRAGELLIDREPRIYPSAVLL